jgi:hypothetical protein
MAMSESFTLSLAVPVFEFSAEAFADREGLTAWREVFGRIVCGLNVERDAL